MTDELLWNVLGYVCLPAWLLAGLVDFWSHRRTDIPHTSGVRESMLHLAQLTQIGIPTLIVLFLDLNALTLTLVAAFAVVHTGTAYWDLRYTMDRRRIEPVEQMAHAFLITLPLFATGILALLWWPDRPHASGAATFNLAWRADPFAPSSIVAVLAASLLLGLLPALAELRQTLRARLPSRR